MWSSTKSKSYKASFTNSPVAVVIISAKPHMVAPIPCVHYWCYNASSVIRITHAHQQVELYLFTSFRLRPPNDAVVGLAHLLLLAYRYQLVTCITMTDPPSASNLTSSKLQHLFGWSCTTRYGLSCHQVSCSNSRYSSRYDRYKYVTYNLIRQSRCQHQNSHLRSYNIYMANLVQHTMGYHLTKYRVQTLDVHRDMTVTNM